MATLSDRQELLYTHRCDIWRAPVNIGAKGKRLKPVYQRVETDVPCYFRKNPSVDDPGATGPRQEADIIFTLDIVHWGYDQDVSADDILVNKTLRQNLTPAPNYGAAWRVRGNPRVIDDSPDRDAQHLETMAAQMPELPAGVSV
jgi:hypothetical protein